VVNAPAELNEYDVSTVAVDAFADVIRQEIEPVADRLIVDVTLVPCVTVTSFAVSVTSAVTSSAASASDVINIARITASDIAIENLFFITILLIV
jgi:hypothetical protein